MICRRAAVPAFPVVLASLVLSGCDTAAPSTAPRAARKDDWYRLLLNGQPAGFSRQTEEDAANGDIVTTMFERLVVRRGEEPMTLEVESRIEEDARGAIVGFRMVQRMSAIDQVTEGIVREAPRPAKDQEKTPVMEVTARGAGNPRTFTVPHDPAAVGPHRLEAMFLEKLRRAGDAAAGVTFFPEKNGCGKASAVLGEEEEVPFPGGARRLVRRTTKIDILPESDLVEWLDPAGKVWKSSMVLPGGLALETYLSTAAEITAEKYASPPEIFLSTSVRPDRPPRDLAGDKEVVYRFSLKKGTFKSLGIEKMFTGTGQEVVREESPSARVVRISKVAPAAAARRPVAAPAGMESCLAPNVFIQSDDPLVAKYAREAAGDGTDAFETACRLERWVRGHVKFKDLKTAFASAKEVAEHLEGDCTEHGVLLAAMARASGIPARVVSGLVWYGDSFVGHLWTEVYIDRWIPLDGTRGRGEVGPDHIAIAASPLAGGSAADLFLDMVQVIGNLKVEIIEEK